MHMRKWKLIKMGTRNKESETESKYQLGIEYEYSKIPSPIYFHFRGSYSTLPAAVHLYYSTCSSLSVAYKPCSKSALLDLCCNRIHGSGRDSGIVTTI